MTRYAPPTPRERAQRRFLLVLILLWLTLLVAFEVVIFKYPAVQL